MWQFWSTSLAPFLRNGRRISSWKGSVFNRTFSGFGWCAKNGVEILVSSYLKQDQCLTKRGVAGIISGSCSVVSFILIPVPAFATRCAPHRLKLRTFDEITKKSEKQCYSWKKTKTSLINYFIDVIGDVPMENITRDMAPLIGAGGLTHVARRWAGQARQGQHGHPPPFFPKFSKSNSLCLIEWQSHF